MIIGINKDKYPEQRCVINKVKSYTYIKKSKSNLSKLLSKIDKKIFNKNISKYDFKYSKYYKTNRINGYHFFNDIGNMDIPYVTTFETFLPRIEDLSDVHHNKNIFFKKTDDIEVGLELISKSNCKKIIALSECNYNMQRELLKQYPKFENAILNKMVQISPPQEVLINSYDEKQINSDIIRFIFVGRDFVRKGGVEIVRAFDNIQKEKYINMELVLITDLNNRYNYVFKEFQDTDNELGEIINIIRKNENIKYYEELPNEEVLNLIKSSHIGVLPTWGDTYGYSVLEFQALGCPVISTNVRALTEINNYNCGWLINVPTNRFGEIALDSSCEKEEIRGKIIKELEIIIENINNNKEIIKEKGIKSLQRIKEHHLPENYEKKIKLIYDTEFII